MIGLGLGIGNRRRRRGPTALRQFVTSATKGAWFWPAQAGSLWQTETQTTPVTAVSQSVGRIDGNGASGAVAFSQSSSGLRPVFAAGGLVQPNIVCIKFLDENGLDMIMRIPGWLYNGSLICQSQQ